MMMRGSARDRAKRLAAMEVAAKPQVERARVILYDPAVGPPTIPPGAPVVVFLPCNGREAVAP